MVHATIIKENSSRQTHANKCTLSCIFKCWLFMQQKLLCLFFRGDSLTSSLFLSLILGFCLCVSLSWSLFFWVQTGNLFSILICHVCLIKHSLYHMAIVKHSHEYLRIGNSRQNCLEIVYTKPQDLSSSYGHKSENYWPGCVWGISDTVLLSKGDKTGFPNP